MLFSIMSNLQTQNHFNLDFQKVNQHTRGNWLIHGTKHHKGNQFRVQGGGGGGGGTSREVGFCRTRTT